MTTHRIVQLTAENFKRLTAVDVTPPEDVVIVSGRNGQGKTSLLESIMATLGGAGHIPDMPVRKGAEEASVTIDLGDITVTRTFNPKGGSRLTVKSKEGTLYPSPQAMLDKMTGSLTFDPLAFIRMKPKEQVTTLAQLVKIDFTECDNRRDAAFTARSDVNREIKRLEGSLSKMPKPLPNTPDQEVDIVAMTQQCAALDRHDAQIAGVRAEIEHRRRDRHSRMMRAAKMQEEIDRMVREMATLHEEANADNVKIHDLETSLRGMEPELEEARNDQRQKLMSLIRSSEAVNAAVREKARRNHLASELEERQRESDRMTKEIADIEASRRRMVAEAAFPVKGLSFTDDHVLFNSLPLDQASGAEQVRVSVATGIAANPKLRVLLIKDASLLDKASMAIVAKMAKQHDMQIWLERVAEPGDGVGIIIEDGQVAANPPATTTETRRS